jgi:hypothetical protein
MDKKELRIGNKVIGEFKDIITIKEIYKENSREFRGWVVNDGFSNHDIKKIKPILLTEEVCLKMGFGKEGKNNNLVRRFNQFYDTVDENYSLILANNDGMIIKPYNDVYRIKYVHTMQNLYFALTGKELRLK